MSRSTATIDCAAIRHNTRVLRDRSGVELCAVVKANGYGHGEVAVAVAALDGGATMLAVARVEEARRLRHAGITAPILVLSQPEPASFAEAAELRLEPAVDTRAGVAAAEEAAAAAGSPLPVHLKIDTGMHRVGAAPADATPLADAITSSPNLVLSSVWTHLAVADEPGHPATGRQLDAFDAVVDELDRHGLRPPMLHAANSAGAIAVERARYDMVRCGIALYGLPPSPALDGVVDLRPALTWTSTVSHVKRLRAGDRVSYGLRGEMPIDATVATIPVGYADGYVRALWTGPGHVIVGGRHRRIVGVVTMDQLVVDVGDDDVNVGDPVVLIGEQSGPDGTSRTTADDLARTLDTINYEIVCGITDRVGRRYVHRRRDGVDSEGGAEL